MLKYLEIAKKIEEKIQIENLPQGAKLPSFEELISTYQVSKSTITKALATLESKGSIFQVRGSGIFVRRKKRKGYINLHMQQGFTQDTEGYKLSSKLIWLKIITPTDEIASNLNCTKEDEVYAVKRIMYIDGKILCLEESFYKKSIIPYLNNEIVQDSIFYYIETALGIKASFSDKYLHIQPLNEDDAPYLDLPSNSPALHIDEVYFLTTGEPFNFSKIIYHYTHSQFFLQSN